MRLKYWKNGARFSLGAEFEARYVRTNNNKLSYCATKIKKEIPKSLKPYIHDEFSPCLIEIVSPVCKKPNEVVTFLHKATSTIAHIANKSGNSLIASGIHPFTCKGLKVLKNSRYQAIKNEFGVLLEDFSICGIHSHVGFSSSQEALRAYNFLINYSPIFICLLTNSPIFQSKDTKLLSYRLSMFDRLPRSGIPPYFDTYKQMQKTYEEYLKSGTIKSFNDIWWDLRIKPEFGTLELRIGDSVSDFKRLRASLALYQALCYYAQKVKIKKLPREILVSNRWNAIRYGWDGYIYLDKKQTFKTFTQKLIKTMDKEGIFKFFGTQKEAKELLEFTCKKNLAQEQLDLYKNGVDKILNFGEIK